MILLLWSAVQEARIERPVQRLEVGNPARIVVTVVNTGEAELPGGDFDAGQPCTFVGLWTAKEPPRIVGTFEASHQFRTPLPPGESRTVELIYYPTTPGEVLLCAGLFRASKSGAGNGAVGGMDVAPVTVEAGRAVIAHQKHWIRALIAGHVLAFAGGIALALWVGRRP